MLSLSLHRRFLLGIACLMSLLLQGLTAAAPRTTLPLDGAWRFRLDPENLGETEQWQTGAAAFEHTIKVPGAWDAQGFGPETDKMRNNYIGKGWYQREVELPTAEGEGSWFLRFGGVYRSAKVWVNGQSIGEHIGYVSDFEFDVTQALKGAKTARIVVQIDSTQQWDRDALQGCMDIPDHLFTYWGGIWGHIDLERRAPVWLNQLFVQTDNEPGGCTVSAQLNGDVSRADVAKLEIWGPDGSVVSAREQALNLSKGASTLALREAIKAPQLWSPERPALYTARLTLMHGGTALDSVETRFGVRSIEVDGRDFLVNGRKYYLNGYGDDCVYPDTIAPPSDKQFYLERLKVAKAYGFNFVRHHSHFLPPEYYEACDEIGMFVSPELPIAYMRYYNRAAGAARELYKTEWKAAILRYRNHASIFDWCMGNELWGGIDIGPELYRTAKELDPQRLVIDTDGLFSTGYAEGKSDRPTLDFHTLMFNILTTPLEDPDKFKTSDTKKPIVTHEEGNYVHFPQLDSIELYKGPFKPFWLTDARDRIERAGLLNETAQWSANSQQLYYLCHKANMEALRLNPAISGYTWWLLQPWYPGSNGLVDVHHRPIAITPERVRQINAPTVLLQEGLKLNYRGGETLGLKLSVSNYAPEAIASATLRWTLTIGENTQQGDRQVKDLTQGTLSPLGALDLKLPNLDAPQQATLQVELEAGAESIHNEWTTWVYPAAAPQVKLTHPLYVSEDLAPMLSGLKAKAIPTQGKLPAPAVYVARQPSARLLDAAERGASVVLLSPAGVFKTDVTTYKSAWWLGVFEGDSNAGTMVYDSPVTRATAPQGWCDTGWLHLLQGAQTVLMDGMEQRPEVLIRALNTHGAPHPFSRGLDFEFIWRDKSLLFQTGVGKGSWIVSGLNFDVALREGGPEANWMLAKLIEQAQSLPQPKQSIPLEALRTLVAQSGFADGPLISGFSRVVSHQGPKAKGATYREETDEQLRIQQEEALHHIRWETAPTPAESDGEHVTFVFAGAFMFMDPPAQNPGFGLLVNGKRVMEFDTTKAPAAWTSRDGESVLRYVPSMHVTSWSETVGLFYLSVPKALLTPGQPCTLEAQSIGSDNTRWFALTPYADLLDGAASSVTAQ